MSTEALNSFQTAKSVSQTKLSEAKSLGESKFNAFIDHLDAKKPEKSIDREKTARSDRNDQHSETTRARDDENVKRKDTRKSSSQERTERHQDKEQYEVNNQEDNKPVDETSDTTSDAEKTTAQQKENTETVTDEQAQNSENTDKTNKLAEGHQLTTENTDPLLEQTTATQETHFQINGEATIEENNPTAGLITDPLTQQGLIKDGSEKTGLQGTVDKNPLTPTNQKTTGPLNTLADASLESTLGQDIDTQAQENAKTNKKGFSELAHEFKDNFNKDAAQAGAKQNPAGLAPILANAQNGPQGLLKNSTFKPVTETTLVQSIDGSDTSTSLGNSAEAKSTAPTSQIRAAGYTSPAQSIAFTIAQKAQNGIQQFEIRLNPPELGRVDVRLEFGKDGLVTTHLIVERQETLDMLNKDSRQLERALQEAGVKVEDDGLSFSLKDQESENAKDQDTTEDKGRSGAFSNNEEGETKDQPIYQRMTSSTGLDMSV